LLKGICRILSAYLLLVAILFFLMIVVSIFWMLLSNPSGVLGVMLAASADGVRLAVMLCGIYIVWMGIVQIAIDAGLIDKLARLMSPLIRFLFGKQTKEVEGLIATNLSANMIGAGAAATPAGIAAIEKMSKATQVKASTPMIMLFVLSATSMQILPTTVIGILQSHGATNAGNVILPTIVVSTLSTLVGVIIVKMFGARESEVAETGASVKTDGCEPGEAPCPQ